MAEIVKVATEREDGEVRFSARELRLLVRVLDGVGLDYGTMGTDLWRTLRYAGGHGHDDRGAECPIGCEHRESSSRV